VAVLLVLVILALIFLGPPASIFYLKEYDAWKVPALKVTPKPLTDYSVSDAPGTTLSPFGYSFEVPWAGKFETKESAKNLSTTAITVFKFKSGQNLVFIAPSDQSGLLSELANDKSLGNIC
jgi:hypothetical protein